MCGIVGRLNFDGRAVDPGVLRRMSATIAHRGPDDEGHVLLRLADGPSATPRAVEYRDPEELHGVAAAGFDLGLGFRRLSIIDVSAAGHQPMSNEDGTVWIVFNGEFYNSLDFSGDLRARGHRFKSATDTEVILHLYEEYGIEATLERMNGMFAFVLCDLRRGRVFLARDRVGVKPLYVFVSDRFLVFGSEIKGLLADPEVPRRFDASRLPELVLNRCVNAPNTVFEGIRKVPPGTYWEVGHDGSRWRERRYWSLFDCIGSLDHAGDAEYRTSLIRSVSEHLRSDVPLGVFLSGGLDSSTVSGIATREFGRVLDTFSVEFDKGLSLDESRFSREVSDHLGTRHHALPFALAPIESMPVIARHVEEPIADPALLPTYALAQVTRRFVTVALSGEGSDESNYGYGVYSLGVAGRVLRGLPPALEGPALRLLAPGLRLLGRPLPARIARFSVNPRGEDDCERFMTREALESILSPEALAGDPSRGAAWKAAWAARSVFDVLPLIQFHTWLPDDLLLKVDKMAMAHSLEVRVPYLDHHVLRVAANVDARRKLEDGQTKAVLRRLAQRYLPPSIVTRAKHGFLVPLANAFAEDLSRPGNDSAIRRYLSPARDLFTADSVLRQLAPEGRLSRESATRLWLFAMIGLTISEFNLTIR